MAFQRDNFDKFTERARKVLSLALEEARNQKSEKIETEHLLLALVLEGQGVASKVLENLGLQIEELRETVATLQAKNPREAAVVQAENLSEEAKESIRLAIDEAKRLNHHYIGTEHILLGLRRQADSLATLALKEQHLDLEKVRTMTIQVLSQSSRGSSKFSGRRRVGIDQEAATAAQDRGHFDKFNESARKVLSLSQEEAQRFQHTYIGTEHLLLGLVREGEGIAAKTLKMMGVELSKVRETVEFIIGRGDRIVLGEIGLTPRAKKVIELAVDEARLLNHHYIGTEHLLLGLVREGEGIAAGVLESLGVQLGNLRVVMLKTLTEKPAPPDLIVPPEKEQYTFHGMQDTHHITQQAYQAVNFANTERIRLQDPLFGTEHLLLGLLHNEQSISAQVLKEQGIELAAIYPAIESMQENEERSYPWSQELTALMRAMQDLAGHEAMRQKKELIGDEHLLLAMLRFPESNAMKIIQQLGADPEVVRGKMLERLQES